MTSTSMLSWLPADAKKRRWLAVALLVLLIGLISAAVAVPAVLLHRHYDESIAKYSRQVSTQTAFNATRPRLTEKLEALKSRDVRKLFLKGTSSALALAELQEIVRVSIELNGGRVVGSSAPGNAPKEDGAYRQVASTFTLAANNVNLRRVLYALETKEPYLYIDTLTITASVPSAWRPAPNITEPEMIIQLEVHAFALRPPSELTPSAAGQADAGATSAPNPARVRTPDMAPPPKGRAP